MTNPSPPPFYPPNPPAGSNAIGSYDVGTGQIGDIDVFDWTQTIQSEYANSARMMTILDGFNSAIDPTINLDNFFDMIWNVDTAVGYGLDVWGRIVGVQRQIQVTNATYFGFEQAYPGITTFNFGIFFTGETITSNFSLTDQSFRQLIIAKALANICDGSIPGINAVLLTLFTGRGDCWVADGANLTLTYTFRFTLSPIDVAIISQPGVLPRTAGVAASYAQV